MARSIFCVCIASIILLTSWGCHFKQDIAPRLTRLKKTREANASLDREFVPTCNVPILEIARDVTQFEDELRRDGTITVKSPDVWTDSNLMHSIQEFDREMFKSLDDFSETVQALLVDSEKTSFFSELSGGSVPVATGSASPTDSSVARLNGAAFENLKETGLLTSLINDDGPKLALEPTERERQRATYLDLVQSLRRRKMGGDNHRMPGYGLYLFRIPVTVLPGEETSKGYSAVANIRARMVVTKHDVWDTLPRMAIADVVEELTPAIKSRWNSHKLSDNQSTQTSTKHATISSLKSSGSVYVKTNPIQERQIRPLDMGSSSRNHAAAIVQPNRSLGTQFDVTSAPIISETESKELEDLLLDYLKSNVFVDSKIEPAEHEIRNQLFHEFEQVNIPLQKFNAYAFKQGGHTAIIQEVAGSFESGLDFADEKKSESGYENNQPDFLQNSKNNWLNQLYAASPEMQQANPVEKEMAWRLAEQCGLVDLNIKRLIGELCLKGEFSEQQSADAKAVNFFNYHELENTRNIWQEFVTKQFPLQVFTLEPVFEEQNLVDAQSQLREMQTALALSVANGGWSARQRVELAQQLARESVSVGVNRTTVGFVHGMDTFGWYFHPRIQSPDRDVSNLKSFSRLFRQTTTARSRDKNDFLIEPGVRNCEVMIAMPSFLTQVKFDVTTNWERTSTPGRSKRSYEELITQGCKLERLKQCLNSKPCIENCREQDLERLSSRVEQMEQMLGLQTYKVDLPFDFEHATAGLFDQGERSLTPVVHGYYGLNTLAVVEKENPDKSTTALSAEFFITGKNFHPTLTHVIVGGHEAHSIGAEADPEVEILSRELIRVRTALQTTDFSGDTFEVRVGTPSGLSSPLFIPNKNANKATVAKSDFDWDSQPKFEIIAHKLAGVPTIEFKSASQTEKLKLKSNSESPFKLEDFVSNNHQDKIEMRFQYEIKFDGEEEAEKPFSGKSWMLTSLDDLTDGNLKRAISNDLIASNKISVLEYRNASIKATTYLRLDNWPTIKFDTPVEIKFESKLEAKE